MPRNSNHLIMGLDSVGSSKAEGLCILRDENYSWEMERFSGQVEDTWGINQLPEHVTWQIFWTSRRVENDGWHNLKLKWCNWMRYCAVRKGIAGILEPLVEWLPFWWWVFHFEKNNHAHIPNHLGVWQCDHSSISIRAVFHNRIWFILIKRQEKERGRWGGKAMMKRR